MSVAERDFNSFYLGDNVYELADGVIPEIAERFSLDLDSDPNGKQLGQLVGLIGKNKVLRNNTEITAIDRDTQVEFVERSGVQKELKRSLWTPETNDVDAFILTGAVANWQLRAAEHLIESRVPDGPVYYIAGSRIMDGPSEVNNVEVQKYSQAFGRYPKEFEFAADVVVPRLVRLGGHSVMLSNPNTAVGDEIADYLFEENPHLADQNLGFVRVANAGIQLAVQMRKAAQKINADFDMDPLDPQVYVGTDSFPVARDDQQEKDPANYQKAGTALRQVALTAKMLHEAAGGE
jgi:hypothetical protein